MCLLCLDCFGLGVCELVYAQRAEQGFAECKIIDFYLLPKLFSKKIAPMLNFCLDMDFLYSTSKLKSKRDLFTANDY